MVTLDYHKRTPDEAVEALRRGEPLFTLHNPIARFAYNVNNRFVEMLWYIYRGREYILLDAEELEKLRFVLLKLIDEAYPRHSTMMRCNACGEKYKFVLTNIDDYTKFYRSPENMGNVPYMYMEAKIAFDYMDKLLNLIYHYYKHHREILKKAYGIDTSDNQKLILFLYDKIRENIVDYLNDMYRQETLKNSPSMFSIRLVELDHLDHHSLELFYPRGAYQTINRGKNVAYSLTDEEKENLRMEIFGREEDLIQERRRKEVAQVSSIVKRIKKIEEFSGFNNPVIYQCEWCGKGGLKSAEEIVTHMAEHELLDYYLAIPALLETMNEPLEKYKDDRPSTSSGVWTVKLGMMRRNVGLADGIYHTPLVKVLPPHAQDWIAQDTYV